MIKAFQLLLSLSILIVLHEGGHFAAAKLFHTKVEKFFLFFDVKFALFKKKIGDTVYGIGWLPLGGYVKIAGMIDESMDTDQMEKSPEPWEFRSKPAWQRLIIMLAGVVVNLILGFVIFMMILFVWGRDYIPQENMPKGFAVSEHMKDLGFQDGDKIPEINGKSVKDMRDPNKYIMLRNVDNMTAQHPSGERETIHMPDDIGSTLFKAGEMQAFAPMPTKILDSVLPESPAGKAGLKRGDTLKTVNSEPIKNFNQLNTIKNDNPEDTLALGVVSADGTRKEIFVKPDSDNRVGIVAQSDIVPEHQSYNFGESVAQGFSETYWHLHDYVAQFKYVFTKKGATQVGGFGAIGSLFNDTWNWPSFWETTAFISIILAFMNILPIPALDGGHVMFTLYEIISGRKPNEKFLEYAQMIGIILLFGLVLFANGNDIYRYFFK